MDDFANKVRAMQAEITKIQETIRQKGAERQKIEGKIQGMEAEIKALEGKISQEETNLNSLDGEVEKLKGAEMHQKNDMSTVEEAVRKMQSGDAQ